MGRLVYHGTGHDLFPASSAARAGCKGRGHSEHWNYA
jgi:hypothetical protein